MKSFKKIMSPCKWSFVLLCMIVFTSCKSHKKAENNSSKEKTKKTNIVFILVDDLGYADVGFNGSTYFETPNLDALANESLVFDNAYMYPTCSPSRTAIFTGQQSFRTGVYGVPVLEKGTAEENIFSRWTVGKEFPIYAEPLAKNGYKSIHIGKWHIVGPYPKKELNSEWPIAQRLSQPDPGDFSWVKAHKTPEIQQYYPEGRGFIKNVGGTFRGDPALEEGGYHSERGGYWAPFENPFIEQKTTDSWLTDRLTDEAIEFMDVHKDEPFLINLDYYAVHKPIRSRSDELYAKYIGKEDSITGQGVSNNAKKKKEYTAYATMVESVDTNIQRIIKYLNDNNLRENTMIIVTSDNGYNGGQSRNNLLRGAKRDVYEGGIKVPMLVNWPAKIKPRRTDIPVSCLDVFPTMMDVSGTAHKGILDGNSLTDIFMQDTEIFKERPLFWHLPSMVSKHGTCSAIRKQNYKLIQFLKDGKLELYDLSKDSKEAHNLAAEKSEITSSLLKELVAWRVKNKVPLPPNSSLEF
ncbi:sulfatase [Flavicella sediminum]|uniref:sulfatase n=1 Tax=Flavicella sediminum TaxID=2585141 RepID=UPI001FB6A79F|nr:sulfatase [Flavicella sediminum]